MPKFINLTGKRFSRLVVIERGPVVPKVTMWKCRCDCGNETIVRAGQLGNGGTRSCGCLNREHTREIGKQSAHKFRHGHAVEGKSSREYHSWTEAKTRCYNPKNKMYYLYGGRGIVVDERWKNDFAAFFADMGKCPPGATLDRYPDKDGPYAPGNCRWATPRQQARNTRRNLLLTVDGTTMCAVEWAEKMNLHPDLIAHRIHKGWSPERAVLTSVYHTKSFLNKKKR